MPEAIAKLDGLTLEELRELKNEIDQVIMGKFYPVPVEDFL